MFEGRCDGKGAQANDFSSWTTSQAANCVGHLRCLQRRGRTLQCISPSFGYEAYGSPSNPQVSLPPNPYPGSFARITLTQPASAREAYYIGVLYCEPFPAPKTAALRASTLRTPYGPEHHGVRQTFEGS